MGVGINTAGLTHWAVFQTWDGSMYHDREQFIDRGKTEDCMKRHMRGMPNCPARVLYISVDDSYTPGGRG